MKPNSTAWKAHLTDHAGTDLVYGVLSGYPCCTTNFHQGWPKFAQHLWYASAEDGLAAFVYAPCTVKAKVADGTDVEVREVTDFPLGETILFEIEPAEPVTFALHLRVPSWCNKGTVAINGKPVMEKEGGSVVLLRRKWQSGDRVELMLPMRVAISRWHKGAVAVERGPLLFALRVGERWVELDDSDSYGAYRECHPTGPWNFGLIETQIRHPDNHFKVIEKPGSLAANPWNLAGTPIEIHTQGRQIDQWKLVNLTAAPLPDSPVSLPVSVRPVPIVLIPYGCTTLRIAEFPVVR